MKKEAMLYERLEDGAVKCGLCAHRCRIEDGARGICRVRQNEGGTLQTLVYGEVIAQHVDPIEKKPLYHFLPGSTAYSIATVGCNFKCPFCQNWQISQASVDDGTVFGRRTFPPERVIREAVEAGCRSISYTYTEPTVFFEYALDTARLAREKGLTNTFVTNGYMTGEALDTIRPYFDGANVDLKSFSDEFYKKHCRATLAPVLESITRMRELGIWVEVTTLLVPGENDSEEELKNIARFIVKTDRNMPWHISRFHPDYQLTDRGPTPVDSLKIARDIGKAEGVRYVYLGNVLEGVDTRCPKCGHLLIQRGYFSPQAMDMEQGTCPSCAAEIAGVWATSESS
ncbi:AmmeMemoRadiSam system radical SAM enzyme [Planctomycetota bacterium]